MQMGQRQIRLLNLLKRHLRPSSESSQVTEQHVLSQSMCNLLQEESRTVYVARHGTADVYWYDINSIPSNTNKANVVTMTEADALAQGKRHTSKE